MTKDTHIRKEERFLGRRLNTDTMMWEHDDKSGVPLPEELRQEMFNDLERGRGGTILALARKWDYEEKHRTNL